MKTINQNIKGFLIAIVLLGVFGTISAQTGWQEPQAGCTPPNCNVPPPVNTGSAVQEKTGSLQINSATPSSNVGATGVLDVGNSIIVGSNNPLVSLRTLAGQAAFGTSAAVDARLLALFSGNVGAAKYCNEDGSICKTISELGSGGANLSGTYGKIAKFDSSGTSVNNSVIFQDPCASCARSGFVGIKTDTPSYNLHVNGTVGASAYYYLSDKSLKGDIYQLQDSLEKITSLSGMSFSWKKDGRKDIGLIAQDVEKVFPEIVHTDEQTGIKSVEYANLIAPLIEALKEQQVQIDELKKELNDLKNK